MIGSIDESREDAAPDFSCGIPHGYLSIGVNPSIDQVQTLVEKIRELPETSHPEVEKVLRFYAGMVLSLQQNGVLHCGLGMHPNETGGLNSSVLTISVFQAPGTSADRVLARLFSAKGDPAESGMRPVELRCGLGFLVEEKRRTIAPQRTKGVGSDYETGKIWQGSVAVVDPNGSDIILIQLVTAALDMIDDYRNILLGVAHTLEFPDPASWRAVSPEVVVAGSAIEAVRQDFG